MIVAATVLAGAPAHGQSASLVAGLGGREDFGTDEAPQEDDGSSPPIELARAFPAGLTFGGQTFFTVYVNVNGNISFAAPLSAFTPTAFPGAPQPIIAPWWADADGRPTADGTRPTGIFWHMQPGRFIATWFQVGFFDRHDALLNSFQLILTAAAAPAGRTDFNIEFRYNRCEWTTGDASGGMDGLGGMPAAAGYDAAPLDGGSSGDFATLAGSRTADVLSLCSRSNVGVPGVWQLQVRRGTVAFCGNHIVEPGEDCDGEPTPEGLLCSADCQICGMPGVDCPKLVDASVPDVEIEDATDVIAAEVSAPDVIGRDVQPADAGLDASTARRTDRYMGGGLFQCNVSASGAGSGHGHALLFVAGAAIVALRRKLMSLTRRS